MIYRYKYAHIYIVYNIRKNNTRGFRKYLQKLLRQQPLYMYFVFKHYSV